MEQLDTANLEPLPEELADALPDEVRQFLEIQREKKLQKIQDIGKAIAKKRDEAVTKRSSSGIEEIWIEDEEAYQGIDDANRSEAKVYKPMSPNGAFSTYRRDPSRSTVFLNITRPYVDAAAARISDMLMPTDDKNWAIKPTPLPELEAAVKQATMPQPQAALPQMPQGMPPQGMPPQQPNPMAMAIQQAEMILAEAKKRAEKAEKRIEDWLVQCQWHAELRKVMEDCARLGTGILKGPTPAKRKNMSFSEGQLKIEISIEPESKRVDPWNFYPDPACGENIHDGSYVFEKDSISVRQLRDLKGLPGYLSEQIDQVIEEGPNKSRSQDPRRFDNKDRDDDEKYEIWYYYGVLDCDDLKALGVDDEESKLMTGVPAIVTMVNDAPIKAALNPLDSGEFPYDVMPWQRRTGLWAGVGVGRQIRTPQRMVNAATRNMMDNAGLSGGPILVVKRGAIEPADGKWELTPRKMFFAREEADVRTVQDAIVSIIIPSNQPELAAIIQFAMKMAEDVTGLPQLLQGSMGNQSPDTVGGMQMVMNNASTVLRRIARTFDDCITEPHIRRYYTWLMQYGEDDEKGDFQIDARGSSALVERDIQNQYILQMGALVGNPAFGLDPEKWIVEALKAQRLDPKRFQMDDEKKAQMAQQPPPEAPQVIAAKIRAQTDMERAKLQAQTDMQRTKMDTDRDLVYVQAQERRDQTLAMARMEELRLKRELAFIQLQVNKGINVDDNKVRLAETAAKLRMQKELAVMGMQAKQVASPAVEPPGRAPNGQAFQR